MRGILTVVLMCSVLCLGEFVPVFADTDTPTPTSTETATAPPTLNVNQFWTLPAVTDEAGTSTPAQDVNFSYSADAGDVAIALEVGGILFSLLIFLTVWVLKQRNRGQPNGGGA